jgi:hypothetical protein
MLKFLLIVFLFFLAIYYVFILPFRPRHDIENKKPNRKRAKDSNVDIDYMPENEKQNKNDRFKGGEYIDYEEVN